MSDEVVIIEELNEIIELSDDDDEVEDNKDDIVIVDKEMCVAIENEQEVLLVQESIKPDFDDNIFTCEIKKSSPKTIKKDDNSETRVIHLTNVLDCDTSSEEGENFKIKNVVTASTNHFASNASKQPQKIGCKRKRLEAVNINKTIKNTDSGDSNGRLKELLLSPTSNDNSNDIRQSGVLNTAVKELETSSSCHNNDCYNSQSNENHISSINEQQISETNVAGRAFEKARRHSNINDFSKLKWLKPLKSLSTPPHLQIVIIDRNHPQWRITNDKWLMIEKRLLEALNNEMLRTNEASIGLFDGAKWQRGIKIVGCRNENAFNFITNFILNLDKLWHGAQLDVFPITLINRHLVKVYVPPPTLKTEVILSLIKFQNPTIFTEDWKVLRQRERGNKGGVDLWLSINADSFKQIFQSRGEIKYGINRIFVKPSD